jgi:thiol-disulfide isomerase/thioredoxin
MKTSKPHRLVFFKKEGCPPCQQVSLHLLKVFQEHPEYSKHVTVLQKESHPELVEKYEMDKYPTVLIMDQDNQEISRRVGMNSLSKDWWLEALSVIHSLETK